MPHEFEVREEIELDATPEQVWEAIATGPGIDSWFMGRSEIEPREGGETRMTLMGYTQRGVVTAWEPSKRLALRGEQNPGGTFMAFEYLIEGRDGGSTVLRLVHSGFLGDDWEAEYDALSTGDRMYLRKLASYLTHFHGRPAAYNLFLPGPRVTSGERVWAAFTGVLGLSGPAEPGSPVRVSVAGLAPADGVVEFAGFPNYLGARTGSGLYMFVRGYQNAVVVEYHGFGGDAGAEATERAWRSWLARTFA